METDNEHCQARTSRFSQDRLFRCSKGRAFRLHQAGIYRLSRARIMRARKAVNATDYSEQDFLNFTELADQIATLAMNRALLPNSIGVFGKWGTGKSTVLRLVEDKVRKAGAKAPILIKVRRLALPGFR
jgi:KAP family P-loop domain